LPVIALDHFNIRVAKSFLERVRLFYTDVLGLNEGARPPFLTIGHWLYAGDHPVLHLSVLKETDQQQDLGATTLDHIAFSCVDFDAMRNKLDSFGIGYRVAEVPVLMQRQIFFHDPMGNGVELNFASYD
jgi:catechol 2,3-dioxygenase-like lactoylglutathione lyase family enzyme